MSHLRLGQTKPVPLWILNWVGGLTGVASALGLTMFLAGLAKATQAFTPRATYGAFSEIAGGRVAMPLGLAICGGAVAGAIFIRKHWLGLPRLPKKVLAGGLFALLLTLTGLACLFSSLKVASGFELPGLSNYKFFGLVQWEGGIPGILVGLVTSLIGFGMVLWVRRHRLAALAGGASAPPQ